MSTELESVLDRAFRIRKFIADREESNKRYREGEEIRKKRLDLAKFLNEEHRRLFISDFNSIDICLTDTVSFSGEAFICPNATYFDYLFYGTVVELRYDKQQIIVKYANSAGREGFCTLTGNLTTVEIFENRPCKPAIYLRSQQAPKIFH